MAETKVNPLVVTLCEREMLCVNCVLSMYCLDPKPDWSVNACSLVTKGRNEAASTVYLDGRWTHLFFIDSDIGFEPAQFWRLLESGYDVAAAPYVKRNESGKWVIDRDWVGEPDENGFAKTELAATGFMCIKREVLAKMREHYGASEIFDTGRDAKDQYYSEDIAFCMRWRNIGGEIHLDTKAKLTHQGTRFYEGDFAEYLRNRA